MPNENNHLKQVRSFARRIGKSLSPLKANIVKDNLEKFSATNEKLVNIKQKKIILEVGFGMGDHFCHMLENNNEGNFYIGCEPFMNGVAKVLQFAVEKNIDNFLLFADDIHLLFAQMPDNFLDEIYVLFPDPWPKKKHLKRRLLNQDFLNKISSKLKPQSSLFIATDHADYQLHIKELMSKQNNYLNQKTKSTYSSPFNGYYETKYHKKANKLGWEAEFYHFKLK